LSAVWQRDVDRLSGFDCREKQIKSISLQLSLSQRQFSEALLTLRI